MSMKTWPTVSRVRMLLINIGTAKSIDKVLHPGNDWGHKPLNSLLLFYPSYHILLIKRTVQTLSRACLILVWLCAHHCHMQVQITACRQIWQGGAKHYSRSKASLGFCCFCHCSSTFDGNLGAIIIIIILKRISEKLYGQITVLTAFIIDDGTLF